MDERWNVTVNGQTIRVDADGSFRLPNIAAADLFGATGPGSAPDFKSDEWFQVVGTATIDGVTWYAYSEPFQIESSLGGPITYSVITLPVTRRPPADIPESIAIEVVTLLLDDTLYVDGVGGPGETEIKVNAIFAGVDDPRDVTIPCDGTTYRTSNSRVARIVPVYPSCTPDDDPCDPGDTCRPTGMRVEAVSIGTAFVTATNRGATAVQRFVVTAPCVNTLLVGRVVDFGGSPVPGAVVSTEGGSNAPNGTAGSGEFSFNVCYRPGTTFSVAVVGPGLVGKAVLTDNAPIRSGITDVGTVTLGANLIFWNKNNNGNWTGSWGESPSPWHTGAYPSATSHVYINGEDRLPPPFPNDPYTVTLPGSQVTEVAALTLDSPNCVLITNPGIQRLLRVTNTVRFLSGRVEWRNAIGEGGTWINDADFELTPYAGGYSVFRGGLQLFNRGRMAVKFNSGGLSLVISDDGTQLIHASPAEPLVIDGDVLVDSGGKLATTPSSSGIQLAPGGFLEIRGATSTLEHEGGVLQIDGMLTGGTGLRVFDGGIFDLKGGVVRVTDSAGTSVDNYGRLNFSGGAIEEGAININYQGTLAILTDAAPARFAMHGAPTFLEGVIGPGHTVIVEAGQGLGNDAVLNAPDGTTLVNRGLLALHSVDGNYQAEVSLSNGELLVNEAGATLEVMAGNGRDPFVGGALRNKGVVNVRRSMTLGNSNDLHQNLPTGVFNLFNNAVVTFREGIAATPFTNAADAQSTGIVSGIGQLSVGTGRTFHNSGRVEPGGDAMAGTLTVTGNYTQTFGGILDIELGGTNAGQFDKLAVTQQATLAGTMNVTLLPGYTPTLGDSFEVMTFNGRAGDFTAVNLPTLGGGLVILRSYVGNTLVLAVEKSLSSRPDLRAKPALRRPMRP